MIRRLIPLAFAAAGLAAAADAVPQDFRLLATARTSTMEKEMNDAAAGGYAFVAAMGGESAFGGSEVIVIMGREGNPKQASKRYKLLATQKTSTMEKEMRDAAQSGFIYRGQTVFKSAFGGKEVAVIMERDTSAGTPREEYRLLAAQKTSTMEKELRAAGADGFRLMGMTVAETAFGGKEVVCILSRPAAR